MRIECGKKPKFTNEAARGDFARLAPHGDEEDEEDAGINMFAVGKNLEHKNFVFSASKDEFHHSSKLWRP